MTEPQPLPPNAPVTLGDGDPRISGLNNFAVIDPNTLDPRFQQQAQQQLQYQQQLIQTQAAFFLSHFSQNELGTMMAFGYRIGNGQVRQLPQAVQREITKAWAEQAQGTAAFSTNDQLLGRMRDGTATAEDLRTFWGIAGQQAQTIEAQARARYADSIQAATLRGLNADAITKEAQARYADTLQRQQVRTNEQTIAMNDFALGIINRLGRGLEEGRGISMNDLRSYAGVPTAQTREQPTTEQQPPQRIIPPVPGH